MNVLGNVGAAYAARTGGYPPAWSEQPARLKAHAGKKSAASGGRLGRLLRLLR